MNRRDAVQRLHDRHPHVVDAPGDRGVDLEALHLDVYWFQSHVCDLIDERAERSVRRCFATIHRLLVEGDRDVRSAVCHHFVVPHLVFHSDLAWAKKRMPPLFAELCGRAEQEVRNEPFARGPDFSTDA